MSLNLNSIVASVLNPVNPLQNITINVFASQGNIKGYTATTFNEYPAIARIQLENKQNLEHIDGLNLTKIYKRFYISNEYLTGLNRALSTAGDYIRWNLERYNIVAVNEDFNTGWVAIVGCLDG